MIAIVTETGGIRLSPESDADRFILKRLADNGRLYCERIAYMTGPEERAKLSEVVINVIEKKDAPA